MVHKNRSICKSCPITEVSPQRNISNVSDNKYELKSSPYAGLKLEVPGRPFDSAGNPTNSLWHYNNMIKNNRQEFNNLHFC